MGQAKQRKAEIMALKAQKQLVGAYWAYNAGKEGEGFEFSNQHLVYIGMPHKDAVAVVKNVKEAVDFQLAGLENNNPEVLEGLSVAEFIDQEQRRLDWVVDEMKAVNYRPEFQRFIELAIIASCAISTLVKYGRIEQGEFSGDSFMFM